jgi:hypothetical protein
LGEARQRLMHLSLAAFKQAVREHFAVLLIERDRAVDVLVSLVPDSDARAELLHHAQAIVDAAGAPSPAERLRLTQLAQVLRVSTGG